MRALLVVGAVFLIASASTAGAANPKTRPQTGNGIEGVGTAAWPAVAAQLAKNIARDSFSHDYPRVWAYLHPAYQKAGIAGSLASLPAIPSGCSTRHHDHESRSRAGE